MADKSFFNKNSLKFLEKYLNTASPTGYETPGQLVWKDYILPYVDEFKTDAYGTAYAIINPEAAFKVVIEAHADEISWFVNYISEKGMIYVTRNGGSDHVIAPSKRVNIHTKKGIVRGIFGWPAIHTRSTSKDIFPSTDKIWIDVGASSDEEVNKMGIHPGCVITYPDEFEVMNDNYWVCRALDNRIGGFAIAEVARMMHQEGFKPDYGLYFVNAVQEEVGLRGAEMITQTIKPNVALVTDVTHDTTTPHISKIKQGDQRLGKGPVVYQAPAIHNKLRDLIVETAEKNKIPFQHAASSRVTGTDTDAFAYSNGGVPSALMSTPLRYMHTTVEMIHKDDVENLVKLYFHTLKTLTKDFNFSYFD